MTLLTGIQPCEQMHESAYGAGLQNHVGDREG